MPTAIAVSPAGVLAAAVLALDGLLPRAAAVLSWALLLVAILLPVTFTHAPKPPPSRSPRHRSWS